MKPLYGCCPYLCGLAGPFRPQDLQAEKYCASRLRVIVMQALQNADVRPDRRATSWEHSTPNSLGSVKVHDNQRKEHEKAGCYQGAVAHSVAVSRIGEQQLRQLLFRAPPQWSRLPPTVRRQHA